MSLTHDEQHRLNEMEEYLRSSDPAFPRRLDPSFEPTGDRSVVIRSVLLLLLGIVVMVAGAAGVTGLFSTGTAFALLGVALMARALLRLRSTNPPPVAAPAQ